MGFSNGKTGEKCLVSGIYNPRHWHDQTVNLIIFKGETFPPYNCDDETIWNQTEHLCVLREYVLRFTGVKSN